ncbi:histidine phosphatase family protein [Nocardioides anomalus]|uniref:Histidine phosphatase family protein n=1 Tax=Nocardioides anomalus TaxID=2712223 RepID=A0A6G6WEG7_9ACTN|nr:histidine phosphatase family protein [Nocardioides anomalus]QIG43632.1 histidine phosphatase family protein [Nocardioides anomalus]
MPRRPYYLVRHGQSEWNLLELTQGQTVAPRLTDLGRAQARAAGELIRADLAPGERVAQIRTSDLVRARETAKILADVLGGVFDGEPVLDERLREQHLGDLEGRPYAETWAAAETHNWSDPHLPVAGGESPYQLRTRMAEAVGGVRDGTVLVSHGDAIRAALDDLGVATSRTPSWVPVPNGAVARVLDGHATWLGAEDPHDRG